jgi:DNA polymerase III sliding clamp (beta) subunit (PCNA family)
MLRERGEGMKLTYNPRVMLEAARFAATVSPKSGKRSSGAWLLASDLHLRFDDSALAITGANMEGDRASHVLIVGSDRDRDDRAGECVVPAQGLVEALKGYRDAVVIAIELEDGILAIRAGGSVTPLLAGELTDWLEAFPGSETETGETGEIEIETEIPLKPFVTALRRVEHAAQVVESRFNVAGILLDGDRLVATDGHRLTQAIVPGMQECNAKLFLPLRLLPAITRLDGAVATLRASAKRVTLSGYQILSFARSGINFPDYRAVLSYIPEQYVTLSTKAFASAVERVTRHTNPRSHGVKFSFSERMLTLSAGGFKGALDTALEQVPLAEPVAAPLTLGLNGKYVGEALASLKRQATVTLGLIDSNTCVGFSAAPDKGYTEVIMPMRLD